MAAKKKAEVYKSKTAMKRHEKAEGKKSFDGEFHGLKQDGY